MREGGQGLGLYTETQCFRPTSTTRGGGGGGGGCVWCSVCACVRACVVWCSVV